MNLFDLIQVGFKPGRHSSQTRDGLTNTFRWEDLPATCKFLLQESVSDGSDKVVVDVFSDLRIQISIPSTDTAFGPFESSSEIGNLLLEDIREHNKAIEKSGAIREDGPNLDGVVVSTKARGDESKSVMLTARKKIHSKDIDLSNRVRGGFWAGL